MKYWLRAFLISVAFTISSCGGGGDGDVVDTPATVPDVLNYEIRQGTEVSLVLSQNPQATVSSTLLTGTFNRITEAFTLNVQPAAPGDNVQPAAMAVSASDFLAELDTELEIALGEGNVVNFSNYSLHVNTTVAWVGDDNPTSGEFDIRDGHIPAHKITVRVIPDADGQGTPGVDIIFVPTDSPNQSTLLTWEQLDGVFDDPTAEPYARIASFAYSMLRFMYEQGELVIFALNFLGDNDDLLEQIGQVSEICDTYPLAPSPAVLDPGMSQVSWYDASHDNSLGSGDTFYLDFTECWDDDETDDFDTLYDGTVNFVNYTEVESGGVLTRIGFEPTTGTGGIDFDYLEITETETTVSNVILETSETITLTGGFSMIFTSP